MTDLLSIGGSAVRNSQLALSVVSNNIANVNTDGYVRQDLDLQEGLPTKNGLFYLGSGAIADGAFIVRQVFGGLFDERRFGFESALLGVGVFGGCSRRLTQAIPFASSRAFRLLFCTFCHLFRRHRRVRPRQRRRSRVADARAHPRLGDSPRLWRR